MDQPQGSIEMPQYQSYKKVWALKILGIESSDEGGILTFHDGRYAPRKMSKEYMDKHNPTPGGYLVIYKDGYESFSPAEAFEEGYTLIDQNNA